MLNLLAGDIAFNRFLQSNNWDSINKFPLSLLIKWTTLKAYNSAIRLFKPRSLARINPSQRAQSLATKLLVNLWDLALPLTYSPLWFQIRPPPLVLPRFPNVEPSWFNLNHPLGGLFHNTGTMVFEKEILAFIPIEKYYALLYIHQ